MKRRMELQSKWVSGHVVCKASRNSLLRSHRMCQQKAPGAPPSRVSHEKWRCIITNLHVQYNHCIHRRRLWDAPFPFPKKFEMRICENIETTLETKTKNLNRLLPEIPQ